MSEERAYYMRSGDRIPVIGLSGNFDGKNTLVAMSYINAVRQAGACPLIVPPCTDIKIMQKTLDKLDGIIFTGGGDFSPEMIGEKPIPQLGTLNPTRDHFEFPFIRMAIERQMPILGICRGEQLLALAMGGRICQDIPSEYLDSRINHSQQEDRDVTVHSVDVIHDTLLASLFNTPKENNDGRPASCEASSTTIRLAVNSFHHQAVKEVPASLRIAAYGEDGIIEAIESAEFKPFLGVQWHPECLTESCPRMRVLFNWLKQEAVLYRQARDLQQQAVSIDSHCDAPMFFEGCYDIYSGGSIERGKIDFDAQGEEKFENVNSRVDIRKMELSGLDSIVMAAYLKQLKRDKAGYEAVIQKTMKLLTEIRERVEKYPYEAGIARTIEEIKQLKQQGKRAILQGIENGYAIGKDLLLVDKYADMGIVYMTLCHNGHNDICDSASGQDHPEHNGISSFGKEVVKALNRRGVMIDVSHASEKTFYDAIDCSQAPIIASHSSVYALCNHGRNLKDEQIKALASHGGMMGICLYGGFLAKEREATLQDAVRHINYVCDLVGTDFVGIGSDFDGGGGITGCNDTSELINLTKALLREGYSQEELIKILGGNFFRVMTTIQSYAPKSYNL